MGRKAVGSNFHFSERNYNTKPGSSVQNWTYFKPEAGKQGDLLGRSAQKSNAEVQRNNREEKKSAAAIAFERERGYKKKAQRKQGSHALRLGRGRRPRRMECPALKRNRR